MSPDEIGLVVPLREIEAVPSADQPETQDFTEEREIARAELQDRLVLQSRTLEDRIRLAKAEADRAENEARKSRAEADRIVAETTLIQARREQAGDDRYLRLGAAVATFLGVGAWMWWLSDLIVRVGARDFARGGNVPTEIVVALVVNAAVALVGLFAVILRGLFRSGE